MGGFGSGRHWLSRKSTTFEYRRLDVRRWQRDGLLVPGRTSACNGYQTAKWLPPSTCVLETIRCSYATGTARAEGLANRTTISRPPAMDTLQLRRAASLVPLPSARLGDVWRFCTAPAASSPVGTAAGSGITASENRPLIERCTGRRRSA